MATWYQKERVSKSISLAERENQASPDATAAGVLVLGYWWGIGAGYWCRVNYPARINVHGSKRLFPSPANCCWKPMLFRQVLGNYVAQSIGNLSVGNYIVNFAVNYIDPNYPVNFAVNYVGLVLSNVDDEVARCSLRQSSRCRLCGFQRLRHVAARSDANVHAAVGNAPVFPARSTRYPRGLPRYPGLCLKLSRPSTTATTLS